MIEVVWTPQFSTQTKSRNIHSIKNTKIDLLDRVSTFDGPEHNQFTEGIKSPVALLDLEKICLNIVKHVQEVSSGTT